jgi:hypothetical protein
MPQVGFEPTIPVFERAQTVHTLDRAATLIGQSLVYAHYFRRLHTEPISQVRSYHEVLVLMYLQIECSKANTNITTLRRICVLLLVFQ